MNPYKMSNGEEQWKIQKLNREISFLSKCRESGQQLVIVVFTGSLLFALGLLGYQTYLFLKYGDWQTKSWVDMGWTVPHTDWIGLQKIIDWIATQHAGLIVFIAGFLTSRIIIAVWQEAFLQKKQNAKKNEIGILREKLRQRTLDENTEQEADGE